MVNVETWIIRSCRRTFTTPRRVHGFFLAATVCPDLVVQIAFLRRQYQMLNERRWFFIYYLPALTPIMRWLNVLEVPSTSLAVSDIVIMDDSISKDQMHEELEQTMAERGILPWRTKIGRDVICPDQSQ